MARVSTREKSKSLAGKAKGKEVRELVQVRRADGKRKIREKETEFSLIS